MVSPFNSIEFSFSKKKNILWENAVLLHGMQEKGSMLRSQSLFRATVRAISLKKKLFALIGH